ncbi:MAG: hypothetical protein CSA62_01245 [Planctomycetota bacterium]|nr:MAG: hypothetical protein CSA62_01245 [Planctomycetota bacterium]
MWLPLLLLACHSAPADRPEDAPGLENTPSPAAPAQDFHQRQLQQLAEAHRARDWRRMQQILSLARSGATPEQRKGYDVYASLMRGLRAVDEQFVLRGFTTLAGAEKREFEMDAKLELALVLEPKSGHEMLLRAKGEQGARTLITVRASIEDFRIDGTSTRFEEPIVRGLAGDVILRAGKPLQLPLQEPAVPGPEVLVRVMRFSGAMRPAGLVVDGEEAMTVQLPLTPFELRRFPKGFASVRKNPSLILSNALVDPRRYLGHIFVASWFLSESGSEVQQSKAIGQLIEVLRVGAPDTHRCVLACLARLAGEQAPKARDREAWLSWWALRQR